MTAMNENTIWIKQEEMNDMPNDPESMDFEFVLVKEEPIDNPDELTSPAPEENPPEVIIKEEPVEKEAVGCDVGAGAQQMPKFSSSSLWYHYNRKEEDRGECKYCKSTISVAGGSVSNLKRHLLRKHPSVPLERTDDASTPSRSRSAETSSITSTASFQKSTLPSTVTVNAAATGSESMSEFDPGSACFQSVPIQVGKSSLTDFVNIIKPLPIKKSKEIDIQLLKMICKEYHPFSIVEDKEFRKFVSMLFPNYQLPSRKTLSTSLLPQLSHHLRENLQEKLGATAAVALTTDGWTSLNNKSFLAITAHYLDRDTKLHSSVLGCLEFSTWHTAENIANLLKKEVSNWAIQDKIVAVITDNAANIVSAVKICKWAHIPCYAHTINLIVKSSIKPIESVVEKVKSIVQYFKKSSVALTKLNETQAQMNLPVVKLKQEVATRWNSLFVMLVRVLQNKLPIISTLAVLGNDGHKLTGMEWEIIDHSIKLLEIFYEVTKEVSAESTVSLPKAEVLTQTLLNIISAFKSQEGLPPVTVEVSERLKEGIEERLLNMSHILGQATLLDPRFKKYGSKECSQKYTQAYDGIVNEVEQLLAQEEENQLDSAISVSSGFPSSCSSFPTKTNLNLWEDFDIEMAQTKTTKSYDAKALAVTEMDKYISENLLARDADPLFWWEQRKLVYPHLYSLVLKRLCIPASSVPSERVFSKAGQILTEKRSRLGPSKLSQIIFINGNV